MEELKDKITLEIEGDPVQLESPNVGQFIDIEKRKIQLTNGTHKQMLFGDTLASVFAYTSVEMIATLEVLVPNLMERLRVKSLLQLKPKQINELYQQYNDKVFPWLEGIRTLSNGPLTEEDDDDQSADNKME